MQVIGLNKEVGRIGFDNLQDKVKNFDTKAYDRARRNNNARLSTWRALKPGHAWLHNPDGCIGGKPNIPIQEAVSGDSNVNSSLGRQNKAWNAPLILGLPADSNPYFVPIVIDITGR